MKFPSYGAVGVLAMCLLSTSALASSRGTGATGNSGKDAAKTCNTCHNGGAAPTVTLSGPETLAAGATGQYTLTIQGGAAVRGGMNVALSAGTTASLEPGTGLQKLGAEVIHSQPKNFDTASGAVSFDFSVIAPATGETFTIFGAGNSTNGNGTTAGDRSGLAQRVVTVTGGTGGGTDAGTGGDTDAGTGTGNEPGNGNDDDKGGCSSTGGAPMLMFVLAAAGMTLLRRRQS
ncbi:MAG TPA: MXAN_6652 family MXYO-CTERM-anchored protein [Archangium sp.]|jgi:uncharacterized protein (TIGR03382 family)|uniref:MXAN_6652 family MXYO-CTERM-anchored protein n=1 Tax=Archangium sp. TaxID=1872627 RepID=UPI002ED88156